MDDWNGFGFFSRRKFFIGCLGDYEGIWNESFIYMSFLKLDNEKLNE